MDGLTMKAALAIGALLLIGFLWVVWKFFSKVFKHVVIVMVISVLGTMLFVYLRYGSSGPRQNPNIGKHAYIGGEYLGEVVAEDNDSRRGKVWIIRPLGSNHTARYAKTRVTLKDTMEFKPAPTSEDKPASDKEDKKVDTKKKKN
jgi:hypothetical protein